MVSSPQNYHMRVRIPLPSYGLVIRKLPGITTQCVKAVVNLVREMNAVILNKNSRDYGGLAKW